MLIAHLADVHLDSRFAQFDVDAQRKRQTAIEEAFKAALATASDRGADVLLIAGDLYEQTRFRPNTARFLVQTLADFGRPVFLAPGNHDYFCPQSIYATEKWPANVHVFCESSPSAVELEDGLTLWGLAHRAPTTQTGPLAAFHVDRGGLHLAVFHGSEQSNLTVARQLGGDDARKDPYGPFSAAQVASAGFAHAFVGHIHTPADHALFTYPGNPEPLTFGEHGDLTRGLVLARIDGSGVAERERVSVAQICINDIEIDLSGCVSNSDVRDAVSAELQGLEGFVRAELRGEVGEAVDVDLRELQGLRPPNVDAVVFQIGALHAAYPIEEIAQETNTVRGRFVNDVLNSDLDEHEKRRVITTGLRALDRRKDLAVI